MFFISDALAQTAVASDSAGGILMQIVPIALIFVVFWFFLIRPQQKRQKEHMKMCSELAKGDEILTLGGIAGRISDLTEQYIVIEISRDDHHAARRGADGAPEGHHQVDLIARTWLKCRGRSSREERPFRVQSQRPKGRGFSGRCAPNSFS